MKFGICSEIFKEWDIEKVFPFVREAGYQGLEVAPFTIADSVERISPAERSRIKKLAETAGVKIIGTHWLLVKPEGLSLSSRDGALRKKTADYLCELVNFTADIGGDIMVFGSPKQRSIGEGQTYEEVKDFMKQALKQVLAACEKRGVFLCLEPLARTETNFMNTAAQAVELIEEINDPYLKLHLDVKAMSDEAKSISEIIMESSKHLKHFHVNDRNLGGPGFGDVDYAPIIKALKDAKYGGWLSVEVFDFTPGPETIAKKSIEYLKKFV